MKTKLIALDALRNIRRALEQANDITIWYSQIETLFAYVDASIAALEDDIAQPVEQVASWQVFQNDAWEWCKDTEVAFYKSCNKPVRPLYSAPQEAAAPGAAS